MPDNAKLAFYREQFNLALVEAGRHRLAGGLQETLEESDGPYRLSAIRDAILDLRSDLAQINQVIRVLEWLAANPAQESS